MKNVHKPKTGRKQKPHVGLSLCRKSEKSDYAFCVFKSIVSDRFFQSLSQF